MTSLAQPPVDAASRRWGHAISLLVHERPDVVVDQCRNFETFAPHSLIMVHVSGSADFDKAALAAELALACCTRTMINPVSVPSRWGNVIAGHLANIRELANWCDPAAMVAMNASNDLLLRTLPASEASAGPRFELREVSPTGVWYTGRQFARSAPFGELLRRLGCSRPVGSQIEGSSYPLSLLADLAARLEHEDDLLAALPLVAEETVFPSFAFAHLGTPAQRPFVLFRPSPLTGFGARILPRTLRRGALPDLAQKAMNRVGGGLASPDARRDDIEAIIAGRLLVVPGWPNGADDRRPLCYHGIKRIPRDYANPLRARIRAHTLSHAARQEPA